MTETGELVLGVDPGDTTGWSLWEIAADAPAMRLSYGAVKAGVDGWIYWARRNLELMRPSVIIFERFNPDLGYGTAKDYQALEVQGSVKTLAAGLGIDLIMHDTSMKALCSDADLKRLGFWITPAQARVDEAILHEDARDVNDSQIHVLAHAKAVDHEPTVRAFWPPISL